MHTRFPASAGAGFTLLEVLVSLGLCALLATTAAAAVVFAARAERGATRAGEAVLLLQSVYAAQRLRPEEPFSPPRGWRLDHANEIVKISDDLLQDWHLLALHAEDGDLPPFTFRILDDRP
jgi:type II secretory pathway pseudopilin PulG